MKTKVERKIDGGVIMIPVTAEDREKIAPLCERLGCEIPAVKASVYKNRRGRWKDILVWCRDRRATCKIEPMFITDYRFELIQMEDYKITVIPKEEKKVKQEIIEKITEIKQETEKKKKGVFDF